MEQFRGSLQNYTGSEFANMNGYTIYEFDNNNDSVYFLAMPNNQIKNYNLFVGFPTKDFRNIPRAEILEQIKGINDMLVTLRDDLIYLVPAIPTDELEQAVQRQDDQKFRKILNEKIQPMVYDIYNRLTSDKEKDKTVSQMISIVEQTEADAKFVAWLKANTVNIKHGITLEQLKKYYYSRRKKDPNESVMKNPLDENIITDNGQEKAYDADKQNIKVRTLSKPTNPYGGSYGFGNIPAIVMVLIISVIVGLALGFLLIKTRM